MENAALLILVVSLVLIFFMSFETFITALPWLVLGYFVLDKI